MVLIEIHYTEDGYEMYSNTSKVPLEVADIHGVKSVSTEESDEINALAFNVSYNEASLSKDELLTEIEKINGIEEATVLEN